ncbi:uncharacterized protein LOC132891743 isoform X7 [Neoarius graeffei]|uniref:uncharacterized protein LOC132891743 isoform X7 n=1 Tax=Neoarius graeffei TaxID=443677 RepID=UPI00298C9342|nr:uncharacterized protein LOC132891743 isoform X7 [Neoarius graeffei]
MKVKYFVGILLAMQCVTGVSTRNGPALTCCTKRSTTQVEVKKIKSYMYQNGPPCKTIAVRFLLFSDKTICSDPENPWAQLAMKILDERKTKTTRNTPPPWTSTSWTETTTSTSSPEASPESTITMTTPKGTSTTWTPRTSITSRTLKKKESDGNRKQKITVTSQKAEKEREAYEWTEHFCQWSEIQETRNEVTDFFG